MKAVLFCIYVCNNCKSRPFCNSEMYVYTAKSADEKAAKRRSDTRKGIRLNETDPMASWQKPKVEKNHEFIRYIIPKGKSMAFLTEEKVVLLMPMD